jgi:hypothetical protein
MTVIDFPNARRRRRRPYRPYSLRTFAFRSYCSIVKSNEADLIKDVCVDMDRAQSKLRRIKQRLENVRKEAAAQIELLTTADAKLAAAIDAATAGDRN